MWPQLETELSEDEKLRLLAMDDFKSLMEIQSLVAPSFPFLIAINWQVDGGDNAFEAVIKNLQSRFGKASTNNSIKSMTKRAAKTISRTRLHDVEIQKAPAVSSTSSSEC